MTSPTTLNTPPAIARARYLVPLLFGLYALLLGQDYNWDMRNYHLYDGFALLHGKLSIDLAPAGMQTWFNPALDVVTWLLYSWLPAPLVGFAFGVLHGLAFVLVFDIARHVLDDARTPRAGLAPLLLALAGCLSANFLTGIGNSMGDNTTALLVLLALALTLRHWDLLGRGSPRALALCVAIGASLGLAAGLKLTNTVYAVALCAACIVHPGSLIARLRIAFLTGIGVLAGIAAGGGFWFATMWRTFRNPIFPQFSNLFPNPLVPSIGVADQRWFPHGIVETLLWPFIFSANSARISDVPIRQIIWALLYAAAIVWVASAVWRAAKARGQSARSPSKSLKPLTSLTSITSRQAFVLVFIALGYVLWLKMFSVYRYVVPMEMLAPLALYLLLDDLLPGGRGKRVAAALIGIATLVVAVHGAPTYGHVRWAWRAVHADTPPLADPSHTTGVLLGGQQGLSWLVTQFPPEVAFVSLEPNVLVTPLYHERLNALIARRGGPAYVIVGGVENGRLATVRNVQAVADRFGLLDSPRGCAFARRVVDLLHLHLAVETRDAARCRFTLRADDARDVDAENATQAQRVAASLEAHGLRMTSTHCAAYGARIGDQSTVYQWCPVELLR